MIHRNTGPVLRPNDVPDGYYWIRSKSLRDSIPWTPVQILTTPTMPRADSDKMVHFFQAEEMRLSSLLSASEVELLPLETPNA